MKDLHILKAGLALAALVTTAVLASAQIERLTLQQMVVKTDGAVVGEITNKEVIRIDHEVDGPELYFTHMTIEGRSLVDGKATSVVVTFPGGFIDEEHGVWNSESPSDEDTKLGNQVVAFWAHTPNMGGDLEADALYAGHGGLFRTVQGRKGTVVLGRGEGYAVDNNVALTNLDTRITELDKAARKAGQK